MSREDWPDTLTDEQLDELMDYGEPYTGEIEAHILARVREGTTPKPAAGHRRGGGHVAAAGVAVLLAVGILVAAVVSLTGGTSGGVAADPEVEEANTEDAGPESELDLSGLTEFYVPYTTVEMNGLEITPVTTYWANDAAWLVMDVRDVGDGRLDESTIDVQSIIDEYSRGMVTSYNFDEGTSTITVLCQIDLTEEEYALFTGETLVRNVESLMFQNMVRIAAPELLEMVEYIDPEDLIAVNEWDEVATGEPVDYTQQNPKQHLPMGDRHIEIPGLDDVVITNLGYDGENLHFQFRYDEDVDLTVDQYTSIHTSVNLLDAEGKDVPASGYSVTFGQYVSYVLTPGIDMTLDELKALNLYVGRFTLFTIDGPWQMVFTISDATNTKTAELQLEDNPYVSELSVTSTSTWTGLTGAALADPELMLLLIEEMEDRETAPYLTLADGRIWELYLNSTSETPDVITLNFGYIYIDIEEIVSITIFGETYELT